MVLFASSIIKKTVLICFKCHAS